MRRSLSICALSASLLGALPACTSRPEAEQPAPVPQAAPPPPAAPAPTPPPAAEAPAEKIDPSLVQEARAMLPPPLLYARFRPEVGTFVEYEVSSTKTKTKTRVRAAMVGKTVRPTGEPMYQVEFSYADIQPRTLVVAWVIGDERPLVERLALSVEKQTPVSVPVDLYLDLPDLRGAPSDEREVEVKGGPFAGKARQRGYKLAPSGTADVTTSEKVPLFGVQTVRLLEDTWVARRTGTGASPELTTIPVSVPRMPGGVR